MDAEFISRPARVDRSRVYPPYISCNRIRVQRLKLADGWLTNLWYFICFGGRVRGSCSYLL